MNNSVLIIGAGPTGLCLALALAKQGLEVDLVERQSKQALAEPAYDGREVALTHASMRQLREMGVWQHIAAEDRAPLRQAQVMDSDDAGFRIDGAAFGREQLGTFVSNHAIRAAAWQAVSAQPGVRIHTDVEVDSVECDVASARARLADGRTLEAALLVAADSRFSQIRRAMGISTHMHDFGKTMLLCRIRHTESNHGTSWEWFGHGQTRALLALDAHVSSAILTLPDVEAQALKQLSDDALAVEIEARFEDRLGDVGLASTVHSYPLVATWARRFVAERFALAGDAAVGMHPVTAHGFNLALASVEHLAQAASDGWTRYRDTAHAQMLARYQRRHRINSAVLFLGTQTVADLFTSEHAFAQPLRRAIMKTGRQMPPLRRALAASLIDDTVRPGSIPHHLRTAVDILRPRLARSAPFQRQTSV